MEVLDEDVDGTNDDEEEDRPKKTKEVMPRYLSSDDILTLNVNRETLQESKFSKVISENLVRNTIEMLLKLAQKDKSKEEKDYKIDDKTKEAEINEDIEVIEVGETDNDELVVDDVNNAPPPQDSPTNTTTTAAATEEGGDNDDDEADNIKGGGGNATVEDGKNEDGNDDDKNDDKEDVMDVLPPLVVSRVERLKCLNTERERVMERYLEERAALKMKYFDICKPLYEERGNVVTGCLDDDIEKIRKERGGKKGRRGRRETAAATTT